MKTDLKNSEKKIQRSLQEESDEKINKHTGFCIGMLVLVMTKTISFLQQENIM